MAETKDDTVDESSRGKRPRAGISAAVEERQLNFIQIAPDSTDSSTGRPKRDKKTPPPDRNSVEAASKEKFADSRASRVPDSVHERFIHIGNNFYFPDRAEAFSHEPGRLTTRS